jgi:hypothetical protein
MIRYNLRMEKSFITLGPRLNIIKLFMSVIYKYSYKELVTSYSVCPCQVFQAKNMVKAGKACQVQTL